MVRPDFSIIIPTFNRPVELAECLKALAGLSAGTVSDRRCQRRGDIPAADAISRLQNRPEITTLRQKRKDPATTGNAGPHIGRGKYVAFTDYG